MKVLLAAALLATLVAGRFPVMQDPQPRVLLRLEDDWAQALIHRDAAVFRRLLADGFIYTEDDRTVSRDDVLHDVVAGLDTVTTAHNEAMRVHRFGATAIVTGWLVVGGHGPSGAFDRRYRFTTTWSRQHTDSHCPQLSSGPCILATPIKTPTTAPRPATSATVRPAHT